MIGRLRNKLPKPQRKAEAETPSPSPPAETSSPRLGLFDTFRLGWEPPRRVAGAKGPPVRSTATTATATLPGARAGDGALRHPVKDPQLLRQRDDLARQFAELQWDLGGIVYEMSSRKDFKPEILDKQVEKLSEVDSKLGQVERLVRLDQEGAAGTCPACGSLQARGAVFCWQCGKELTPKAQSPAGKSETAAKAESK